MKAAAGSILDDDDLRREGRLHQDRAEATAAAGRLAEEAEQRQAQADFADPERALVAEEQAIAIEAAAAARETRIERERSQAEQQIAAGHEALRAQATAEARAAKAAIAHDEAQAAQRRDSARRDAAALDAEAERARATADELDRAALRTSKGNER